MKHHAFAPEDVREFLERHLTKPRDLAIIRLRFGIGCPRLTHKNIGEIMPKPVQAERIRQMEAKLLRILRFRMHYQEGVKVW